MVEITVCWGGQLQGTEANVIKCLVVDAVGLICVFYKLMDRESGIVRLYNSIRYFG